MCSIRIRVAVIIRRGHQVLLVEHQKDQRRYWLLPGGGLEYGESVLDCARRELKEETNLDIKVGRLAFTSETLAPDLSRHILHVVFFAEVEGGELKIGDEERLLQTKFVDVDKLDELIMHPPIAAELKKILLQHQDFPRHLGVLWRN